MITFLFQDLPVVALLAGVPVWVVWGVMLGIPVSATLTAYAMCRH